MGDTASPLAEIVDIAPAARSYRQLWIAVRIMATLPCLFIYFYASIILFKLHGVKLDDRGYGSRAAVSWQGFVEKSWLNHAVDTALVPLAVVFLFCAARYSRKAVLGAIVIGLVLVVRMVADGIDQDNFKDRDVLPLTWIGLVLTSYALAIWSGIALARKSNVLGQLSALQLASRFEKVAALRRQTFWSIRWSRTWMLVAALVASFLVYYGIGSVGMRIMRDVLVIPNDLYSDYRQLEALAESRPWTVVAIAAMSTASILVTAAVAYFAWRAALRRVRRSAEEVIADHDYRPLLFLRSFQDENAQARPRKLFQWLFRIRPRLEEFLVNRVSRLGPAVAIGLPGERVPPLGALRAYYADDQWQGAVLGWMQRSYAIVVLGGISQHVLWELREVLRRDLAGRLVLIIPPDAALDARRTRWSVLRHVAQRTPWEASLASLAPERLLAVVFDRGGRVLAIEGSTEHQSDYEFALQVAVSALAGAKPHAGVNLADRPWDRSIPATTPADPPSAP